MVFVTFCIRIYSSRISITTSYIFVFLLIVDRENNNSRSNNKYYHSTNTTTIQKKGNEIFLVQVTFVSVTS